MASAGRDWNFNVMAIPDAPLYSVVKQITSRGLKLPASSGVIMRFISEVEESYEDHPYHSSTHAADAVNSVWVLLTSLQKKNKVLTQADMFVGLISAAIHDVGHRGVSNNFLIHSSDELAVRYNDLHVLENFHLATAFTIAREGERCNIFETCNVVTYEELRKSIISVVFATDLADHFSYVSGLRNTFRNLTAESSLGDIKKATGQILVGAMLCADLGHGSKPFLLHEMWSAKIAEEFYMQGDLEVTMQREVSPLCLRGEGAVAFNASQVGFLKFLVMPLFDVMKGVMPAELFSDITENIGANVKLW